MVHRDPKFCVRLQRLGVGSFVSWSRIAFLSPHHCFAGENSCAYHAFSGSHWPSRPGGQILFIRLLCLQAIACTRHIIHIYQPFLYADARLNYDMVFIGAFPLNLFPHNFLAELQSVALQCIACRCLSANRNSNSWGYPGSSVCCAFCGKRTIVQPCLVVVITLPQKTNSCMSVPFAWLACCCLPSLNPTFWYAGWTPAASRAFGLRHRCRYTRSRLTVQPSNLIDFYPCNLSRASGFRQVCSRHPVAETNVDRRLPSSSYLLGQHSRRANGCLRPTTTFQSLCFHVVLHLCANISSPSMLVCTSASGYILSRFRAHIA